MTTREGMMKAAEILDAEEQRWIKSKAELMPAETSPTLMEAHDRYFNYIENAKRLAKEIRRAAAELADEPDGDKPDALVAFLRGLANRAGARAAQFYSYPHGLELEAEQRKLNEAAARIEALEKALNALMAQPTMSPLSMTPDQRASLWAAHKLARAALEGKG